MADGDARLSRLLWDAREWIEMYADHFARHHGRSVGIDSPLRRTVAEIDAYRAEQGWSPDGFGGEDQHHG
jgi:hypothetical protein